MTLGRTLTLYFLAQLAMLGLIAAAALWGMNGLRQDFSAALDANQRLRHLFEVGAQTNTARTMLLIGRSDQARLALQRSRMQLRELADDPRDAELRAALTDAYKLAEDRLPDARLSSALNRALGQIAGLAAETRRDIQRSQLEGERKRRTTIWLVEALAVTAAVGAGILGWLQYRAVTRPVHRLTKAAHEMADGNLEQRVPVRSYAELADLATSFNRMAAQLQEIYANLEQQVVEKSQQLARSERLASVGHLAAGVAHEINNPLAIIAGHVELALRQRENAGEQDADAEVLQLVLDESYRCKQIVEKLLSLARGATAPREPVQLAQLARDVADDLSRSGQLEGRTINHEQLDANDAATVNANAAELRQVILNLLLNAIDATDANAGKIELQLNVEIETAKLTIIDNGRGIAPDALHKVFEPFYSRRAGHRPPGTGLGLSISHAIVQAHDGELTAHSAGEGSGARFAIRLPLHVS